MANFKLAKLYDSANQHLHLKSTEVYDAATKKVLSTYIADNDATISAIQAALSGHSKTSVVNDIAARDALTGVNHGDTCWVKDATSDSTVDHGAACYIAEVANSTVTWTKISESESMDVVLQWANIQNKPASSVADIDQAVADDHTHTNKSVLDGIGVDATSNNLTYNNVELNGETGLAFVTSTSDTPNYHGQLKIVVEDFDDSAA